MGDADRDFFINLAEQVNICTKYLMDSYIYVSDQVTCFSVKSQLFMYHMQSIICFKQRFSDPLWWPKAYWLEFPLY